MTSTRIFARRLGLLMGSLLITIALLIPTASFAQETKKIAFVDLQRALNEVDEGKKAKTKLKKEFEERQKQLDKRQKELEALKAELEQQMMLSEEAKRGKAMNFQQKMYELQQTYMQLQGELAQQEAAATKKIFDKMGKIIEEMAKEKGYDLVLERTESAILFAKDNMELTDELIKRYNKKY